MAEREVMMTEERFEAIKRARRRAGFWHGALVGWTLGWIVCSFAVWLVGS